MTRNTTHAKIQVANRQFFSQEKGVGEGDAAGAEASVSPPPRPPIKNKPKCSAARLPHFSQAWQQVTSNSFILNIVCNGYLIQFSKTPYQTNFVPRSHSHEFIKICSIKVKEFLSRNIIKRVSPGPGQYVSHIFPVPKKTEGEYRIIFDLSELNEFVCKIRFKMDSLSDIMDLIRPGDYFVSIDLSDAYYCIAMHLLSMPYLTFIFLNVYYQFTCLPQGLSSAPRIFTKVMRCVLSYLRCRGIRIAAWIDDFLISSSSLSLCREHTSRTIRTFEELGFLPNIGKSQLTPVQRICHLGLVWDSLEYSVSVPADKIAGVRSKCLVALSSRVPVRFLSSVLGSIEYFRWGFPHAALHYRRLQRFVNKCLEWGYSYGDYVSASSEARIDLCWWSKIGDSLPSRPLSPFYADYELCTDASQTGWGCWTSDDREACGAWSSSEALLHSNVLEFRAVFFGFQCFYRSVSDCGILIRSDNSTVVAYINKQGGTVARLCDQALELWEFCVSRGITIQASHLSGVSNVRADRLSRVLHTEHSYELSSEAFDTVVGRLSFPLKIDCFASRLDYKIDPYYSRYYDPFSSGVDAFTFEWTDNVYLFPPVPIIDRVISKFFSDNTGHGLLICPFWPSQPWFPSLLELLIAPPLLLPSDHVLDNHLRLPSSCQLVAWPIGLNHVERQGYLGRLGYVGSRGWLERPSSLTKGVGKNSVLGIIDGLQVTVELL